MIYLNALVSLLTVAGLTAAALAWRHSLRQRDGGPEWYFAAAKVLFAVGIGFRLLLWDVGWGLGTRLHVTTQTLFTAMGGVSVNMVSNGVLLCGVYCSLRSRWLLIPPQDRHHWPWWRAWQHPDGWKWGRRRMQ